MDIATIIGIVAAFGLVLASIFMGGNPLAFLDIPSVLIVFGGTIGAVLINYPMGTVIGVIGVVKNAFFHTEDALGEVVTKMVEFAKVARRDGVLALEAAAEKESDAFLVKGLSLVVDGTEPELTRQILDTELEYKASRHKVGAGVFEAMGNFAPALGMIGTLIGLVQMLQNMSDPTSIGPAMAVALITTLYGAVIANLVCIPIAGKLKKRSDEEQLAGEMVIAGIMSIQSGDNPRIVEQKLNTFLPPAARQLSQEK
ncbi:MAG: MotA/TolQ/ExbB proton channel family protein [Candidatus Schekmanbacteria bacterium]|nr:MotA/TolQ/ExbB proton channel family protein [Candidatus Schekmanbacteria bacterium]